MEGEPLDYYSFTGFKCFTAGLQMLQMFQTTPKRLRFAERAAMHLMLNPLLISAGALVQSAKRFLRSLIEK